MITAQGKNQIEACVSYLPSWPNEADMEGTFLVVFQR